MNSEIYIRRTIAKHLIKSDLRNRALFISKRLYPIVKRWAFNNLISINPSGSFAKETTISGTSDIDLFISLKPTTPLTLKENYEILADFLRFNDLSVKKQNVSIRVTYKDIAIDLVPGRRQPGVTCDHSLYFRKTDTWIKTNIYKHISVVKQSNCKSEIRAIKIWRKLHNLDFPSFYLEMSVIQALKGYKKTKVSLTLEKILEYMYLEFADNKIIDPANTNNIISDDLSKSEKEKIKKTAYASLNADNWNEVIW